MFALPPIADINPLSFLFRDQHASCGRTPIDECLLLAHI
jgi:hypothetical protein